jgi:hypothetical protein
MCWLRARFRKGSAVSGRLGWSRGDHAERSDFRVSEGGFSGKVLQRNSRKRYTEPLAALSGWWQLGAFADLPLVVACARFDWLLPL